MQFKVLSSKFKLCTVTGCKFPSCKVASCFFDSLRTGSRSRFGKVEVCRLNKIAFCRLQVAGCRFERIYPIGLFRMFSKVESVGTTG